MKFKQKKLALSLLVIFFTGLAVLLVVSRGNGTDTQGNASLLEPAVLSLKTFQDTERGVKFNYPAQAEVLAVSGEDREAGILFRMQSGKQPEYFMNVRLESGLRLPANLARVDVLTLAVDGAVRSYSLKYPDYKLVGQESRQIANKDATVVTFNYSGPSGETISQMTALVAMNDDNAIYVSQQSRATDFESLKQDVFEPLLSSLTL